MTNKVTNKQYYCYTLITNSNNNSNNPGNDTTGTSTNMAEKKNEAKFNSVGERDAKDLVDAYNSSLMEQRLSDSVSVYAKNKTSTTQKQKQKN